MAMYCDRSTTRTKRPLSCKYVCLAAIIAYLCLLRINCMQDILASPS